MMTTGTSKKPVNQSDEPKNSSASSKTILTISDPKSIAMPQFPCPFSLMQKRLVVMLERCGNLNLNLNTKLRGRRQMHYPVHFVHSFSLCRIPTLEPPQSPPIAAVHDPITRDRAAAMAQAATPVAC